MTDKLTEEHRARVLAALTETKEWVARQALLRAKLLDLDTGYAWVLVLGMITEMIKGAEEA